MISIEILRKASMLSIDECFCIPPCNLSRMLVCSLFDFD